MKLLYITTIGRTMGFFQPLIKELIDDGVSVDIACNSSEEVPDCYREWGCKVYSIDCSRSPLKPGNIRAIKQIRELVHKEKYDIVHCHTPVAAACTRLACKKVRKHGTKVFYTAHGFHFYKGAPLKNWLIYYPIEWLCSFWTDTLITINKEDYARAKKHFHAKRIEYVPGVGIDTDKFGPNTSSRKNIRKELGLNDKTIMLLSVGELNENKNHSSVIKAIKGIDNLVYVIVGSGDKKEDLEALAKTNGIDLRLMGYRTDVADFYNAADIYILPSIREGLNVSIMEAMASGLPCVVSDIRGNSDLIDNDGGFKFSPFSIDEIKCSIIQAIKAQRKKLGIYNLEKVKLFGLSIINKQMVQLYQTVKNCKESVDNN